MNRKHFEIIDPNQNKTIIHIDEHFRINVSQIAKIVGKSVYDWLDSQEGKDALAKWDKMHELWCLCVPECVNLEYCSTKCDMHANDPNNMFLVANCDGELYLCDEAIPSFLAWCGKWLVEQYKAYNDALFNYLRQG